MVKNDNLEAQLNESNAIINCFIKSCAHDLKSPVASILGLVQIARIVQGKDLEDCLNLIQESAKNMKEIIRNFDEVMTQSQRELKYEVLDADQMVTTVVGELASDIRQNQIEVLTRINQRHEWVSDRLCSMLILKNVIGNAIHFIDHRKKRRQIEIDITCEKCVTTISVRDNGIGIDKHHQQFVGEPFFRASLRSRRGLGLFMVKILLKKLHASFSLTSSKRDGTLCLIRIPRVAV